LDLLKEESMKGHRQIDVKEVRFSPGTTESHKSINIGAAAYDAYIPPGAECVLIQAAVKDIRYTLDGTAPSATVGFVLAASGSSPTFIELTEKIRLRFYGTDATSVLQYCFGN
jgi:hypothetical protein